MRRMLVAALTGAIFAVGLAFAGMTKPEKVIAFLNFTGDWDPSLAFVMGGAIVLFAPLYWMVQHREKVAFGQPLKIPTASHIDLRLLGGSALFGIGWGLGGYCPGPALTATGTGGVDVLLFAAAMAFGMALAPAIDKLTAKRSDNREAGDSPPGGSGLLRRR